MTYSAATYYGASAGAISSVALYDANKNMIWDGGQQYGSTSGNRSEVKIVGGIASLYNNGILVSSSGVLNANPSYIGWGRYANFVGSPYGVWDDIVWGDTENKNIFGAPATGCYLVKDLLNPSSSGLYNAAETLVSSNNMTTTWGVGDNNSPHTILLQNYGTAYNAGTYATTNGYQAGTIPWALNDQIFLNPGAEYGLYVTTISGTSEYSQPIPYIVSGATLSWSPTTISQGSTGVITYAISGGGYWDQSTYSYSMVTKSVYGTVMNTQTIPTQTGTISVPITTAFTPGVYYAEITATKISDGTVNVMNVAYMSVTAYLAMTGYVMNEETGVTISAANMNVTQGLQTQTVTSGFDGNWSSNNGWASGSTITINTTAAGFKQNIHSFTPLTAAAVALNISMTPTTSTYSGVSIGGVVTDSQYGNPIVGASYNVQNGTTTTALTNIAGFARVDGLVNGKLYSVWSNKVGYGNSSTVNIIAVGV
jgi:hypothetical protein